MLESISKSNGGNDRNIYTSSSESSQVPDNITDNLLKSMFEKCMSSWFDQLGSIGAMAEGTDNEVPTAEFFATSEECIHFFKVGLLQSPEEVFIVVSTDIIAICKILGAIYAALCPVNATVQIKTQVGINTIARAIASWEAHGPIVSCEYGDVTFKSVCHPVIENSLIIRHV